MVFGYIIASISIIGGLEVFNYLQYRNIKTVVNTENLHAITVPFNDKIWIDKLSKDDIIDWLTKTCNTPLENINRQTVLEFIIHYTQYKKIDDVKINYIRALNILKKIEDKIEHEFCNNDTKIKFSKFGTDDISSGYKPFIFYSSINIATNITYAYLKYHNFTKHTSQSKNFVYFYKHNNDFAENVIFIHGLGFGIMPYMSFIFELSKKYNVIIPILPNISNMEYHKMKYNIKKTELFPDYEIWRKDFKKILETYGKSYMIGHSFGTIMMGILLKDMIIDKYITKRIFVDPVCFFEKCYKIMQYIDNPTNNNLVDNVFNFIVYDDIYVKYATKRYLFGPEYWITDYELMFDNNLVILSGKDSIVPSHEIYNKMGEYGISCIMVNNAIHGQIFFSDDYAEVIKIMTNFL